MPVTRTRARILVQDGKEICRVDAAPSPDAGVGEDEQGRPGLLRPHEQLDAAVARGGGRRPIGRVVHPCKSAGVDDRKQADRLYGRMRGAWLCRLAIRESIVGNLWMIESRSVDNVAFDVDRGCSCHTQGVTL